MAEGRTFRLDTVDLALEGGWEVESTRHTDEFSRDGMIVAVQYTPGDEVSSISRWGDGHDHEVFGADSPGKAERLTIWLGGRAVAAPVVIPTRSNRNYSFPCGQDAGSWTLEQFIAAVEDPADQAFLNRLLDLVEENSRQPRKGTHEYVWFGKRGTGAMFVYPFGRRHPPFKFSVRQGRLLIAGCWTGFPKVKAHPGFADLAKMLDLSEHGPASFVPIFGLDADELWEAGERVSQAIN